jgi:hypothetical protein
MEQKMKDFGVISLIIGIGFLVFAILVKSEKTHHE